MSLTTTAVWEEFSARLRRFIRSRVDDPDDAEDILQDVFIKIHNSLGNLQDEERLQPWLYRIARNAVSDYYRARQESLPLTEAIPDGNGWEAGREEPDPETELASGLRLMMQCLPEKYRQALILTELEGMKQRELADHLGISLSGAKSRVQRGRELLRDELLDCCHFEFDRRGTIIDYYPHCCRRRQGCC